MEEDKNNKDERRYNSRNIVIAIILVIIFLLILILFLYLIRNPALFGSFAQSEYQGTTTSEPSNITAQNISFDNSYIFASPLKAATSVERIRVTVYILDGQGMGISGKEVSLGNNTSGLSIIPISPVTDDYGRATFDVSAEKPGLYTVEASVGGKNLLQKVILTFN